jgi:hypothetical protein
VFVDVLVGVVNRFMEELLAALDAEPAVQLEPLAARPRVPVEVVVVDESARNVVEILIVERRPLWLLAHDSSGSYG